MLVVLLVLVMVPLCLLSGLESEASKLGTLRMVALRARGAFGVVMWPGLNCMLLMKPGSDGVEQLQRRIIEQLGGQVCERDLLSPQSYVSNRTVV